MKLGRSLALTLAAGLLGSLVAVSAPATTASAQDSSWGCPGCRGTR